MIIKSLTIKNFRGYESETRIEFDNLTIFVGKNDIGKSTILEALDIFFNDKKSIVKIDQDDVNIDCQKKGDLETIFMIEFGDLPNNIIIDATCPTDLKSEYLLLENGSLCVVKKYNNGGKVKTFIKAHHPTNKECSELLLKKNSELKSIISSKSIQCSNLSVNSIMRSAIWDYYKKDLQLKEIEIEVEKEDAKKIWEQLSNYMPSYALFRSDRENSDEDDEIQNPLKKAVQIILSDSTVKTELDSIAKKVTTKLAEVSKNTLDKLQEMDPKISNSLNPVIPAVESLKWADVFKGVGICGDNGIPINKRGSGVKRLILLNFFRAEAENRSISGNGIIYAIEEPETSQHNNNQKMMIDAFKKLSNEDNTQIILTTHSPFLVKNSDFDNIRIVGVNLNSNKKEVIKLDKRVLPYPSLNEANYTAFGEATEEYHNELWSYIEHNHLMGQYETGKPKRQYNRLDEKKGIIIQEQLILSKYIRHMIHHPENHHNTKYTQEELRQSIEDMRAFIKLHIHSVQNGLVN